MKKYFRLMSFCFVLCMGFSLLGNSRGFWKKELSHTLTATKKASIQPYSHNYHPEINGFTYNFGYTDQIFASEPTGYFYYDTDFYYADFSTNSRLYIMRIAADFTCGKMANLNGDKSYDINYRTISGYIHSKIKQVSSGSKRSSSINYITSWPLSNVTEETSTATISTSFGGKLTLSSAFSVNSSLMDGVVISEKYSNGFELSFDRQVTVTTPNPTISHQRNGNDALQAEWFFQFAQPVETSYSLDTYYLFEVKNDGQNYQSYSFGYEYEIKLTCSAWEGYLWHQLRDTVASDSNGQYGLY